MGMGIGWKLWSYRSVKTHKCAVTIIQEYSHTAEVWEAIYATVRKLASGKQVLIETWIFSQKLLQMYQGYKQDLQYKTSDNELLFSSLPSVFQVLSHITGIKATIMWQHSWQTEASRSRRQKKILAPRTKPILANKSQQSIDKDTNRYFPSHPVVVHSATSVFWVTLLQDLFSPQHYNIKAMISQYEREKNWVSIQHMLKIQGAGFSLLFFTPVSHHLPSEMLHKSTAQWNNQDATWTIFQFHYFYKFKKGLFFCFFLEYS